MDMSLILEIQIVRNVQNIEHVKNALRVEIVDPQSVEIKNTPVPSWLCSLTARYARTPLSRLIANADAVVISVEHAD